MAYDYEKTKAQYEALSPDKQKQFASMTGGYVQDFLNRYNAEKNQTATTATTATTTPVNNVAKSEYQGTGTNMQNNYQNQGAGNYSYSPTSQYYEKAGTNQTSTNSNYAAIRNEWDKLSYAEQQAKLKENPGLREGVNKVGGTFKTEEGTTKTETPKTGDGWDYQDNSPERMLQMADNVERMYLTDPGLFTNEQTFRNFFINGKGRTPEQEAFLMDYYKNRQIYNKYDGISAENAGNLLANGKLPDSYINYVKNSNPDRYNAIMQAKDVAEDQIRANASMDTINVMTGEDVATTTSKAIERLKSQGLFVDKDGNLIDDRTENYASDEEKQYAKDAADIIARNLDIDNTVKHTYDDLVDKYGGTASKATLMAMAQDINSDLLREKENNNVELTRLQGYMSYMQQEREDRTEIGKNAIEQLQKQYGMYYSYSPEGMSELAQNQYAATNVTLDQADNGTDTQKQMALQSVLDDYYAKYGDIIQRSEAQVINDVMAYAKKNGVSLSQALQENFITPLKNKEGYKQMEANATAPKIERIGTDEDGNPIYGYRNGKDYVTAGYTYDPDSGTFGLGGGAGSAGGNLTNREVRKSTMREITNYSSDLESAAKNIASAMEGLPLGLNTCGKYVNDYIYGVTGTMGDFGDLISEKNVDNNLLVGAKIGDAIVFDWNINPPSWADADNKKYGHVGIITGWNKDGSLDISSTINGVVTTKTIKPGDDWYSNIKGTKSVNFNPENKNDPAWNPMKSQITAILNNKKNGLTQEERGNLEFSEILYTKLYQMGKDGSLAHFVNSGDLQTILSKMDTSNFTRDDRGNAFFDEWVNAKKKSNIIDPENLKVIDTFEKLIEKKLRKESGAAISSSEWLSNFNMFIPGAGEDIDVKMNKLKSWEDMIIQPTFRYSGMPESYIWLFDKDQGLFRDMFSGSESSSNNTNGIEDYKGTFDFGVGTVADFSGTGKYDSLYSMFNL